MTLTDINYPLLVEIEDVSLTSAEAVHLARASIDRLTQAVALRDYLEMLFMTVVRHQAMCAAIAEQ